MGSRCGWLFIYLVLTLSTQAQYILWNFYERQEWTIQYNEAMRYNEVVDHIVCLSIVHLIYRVEQAIVERFLGALELYQELQTDLR